MSLMNWKPAHKGDSRSPPPLAIGPGPSTATHTKPGATKEPWSARVRSLQSRGEYSGNPLETGHRHQPVGGRSRRQKGDPGPPDQLPPTFARSPTAPRGHLQSDSRHEIQGSARHHLQFLSSSATVTLLLGGPVSIRLNFLSISSDSKVGGPRGGTSRSRPSARHRTSRHYGPSAPDSKTASFPSQL